MISERTSSRSYWYGPYEGYESRCRRRLKEDLGVDESAADTILHLRRQVIELQAHIRQLEVELSAQSAIQQLHRIRYQEIYSEAIWIEPEIQE